MAQFANVVITDAGAALLSQITANEQVIEFTAMAAGKGTYADTSTDELKTATALKNEVQRTVLSGKMVTGQNQIMLQASFSNAEISSQYNMTEIGLFAKNKTLDTDPVLYMIAVASVPDIMPAYNGIAPSSVEEDIYISISNTNNVTITVSENIRADAIHYEDNHNINADSVQTAIDKILSGEALQIDAELSATSENPVQNKIITNQISTLNQALTAVQSNIASMSEKTEDPFNVTIPSNAWTSSAPYTNSVSVTGKGITSEKSYEILGFVPTGTLATDIAQKEALGCITYGTNDTDSMIFIALEDKPSANVTVTMRRCK